MDKAQIQALPLLINTDVEGIDKSLVLLLQIIEIWSKSGLSQLGCAHAAQVFDQVMQASRFLHLGSPHQVAVLVEMPQRLDHDFVHFCVRMSDRRLDEVAHEVP